jgi:hypothetical protein
MIDAKHCLKLVGKIERTHRLVVNASTRHQQYLGTATGNRAFERFEVYQDQFDDLITQLESELIRSEVIRYPRDDQAN